jgi:hypothetical protein
MGAEDWLPAAVDQRFVIMLPVNLRTSIVTVNCHVDS